MRRHPHGAHGAEALECAFCDREFEYTETLKARVGKTVAYDAASKRIWAVCRGCGAWNLLASDSGGHAALLRELEERFEAAPGHATVQGVGLTRIGGGVTIVRLGDANRGTFAFWRYGSRFRRRRIRWWMWTILVALLPLDRVWPGLSTSASALLGLGLASTAAIWFWSLRTMFVARLSTGQRLRMSERHIRRAAVRTSRGAWFVTVAHREGESVLSGPDAVRVLGLLLTYFNHRGGSNNDIARAVLLVSRNRSGKDGPLMNHALAYEVRGPLRTLERHELLALEIAVHEDAESTVAQGELAAMQPAVRAAIEQAEIYETLT